MTGFMDLLKSERGVFCIIALVAATILAALGILGVDQWIDFTKYLTGFLVASKTVTTAVETFMLKKPQIPPAIVSDPPKQEPKADPPKDEPKAEPAKEG